MRRILVIALIATAAAAVAVGAQQPTQMDPAEWRRMHARGLEHRTAWDLYLAIKTAARGGQQSPPFSQLPDWTGLWTVAGGGTMFGNAPGGVAPKLSAKAAAT